MQRKIKVSILLQMFQNYDQGIFRGIAAYAKEHHAWSLLVEQEQQSWTSVLSEPGVRGLIVNLDSDALAKAALRLRLPMVGLGLGGGHYTPKRGQEIPKGFLGIAEPMGILSGRPSAADPASLKS